MPVENIRGVIAPLLTPFNDDMSLATSLYVAHAKRLFDQGCAAIVKRCGHGPLVARMSRYGLYCCHDLAAVLFQGRRRGRSVSLF